MPLDLPTLKNNLEKAKSLARDFVSEKPLKISPKSIWDEHFLKTLKFLETKEAKALLKKFSLPAANPYVESLVRSALKLSKSVKLEDYHLVEATVSALFCPLRQLVGSCFATAPAMYIQQEQPMHLLLDLYDLMMLGKLKRVFGGVETTIPISPKWGNRETDHPLLRVWEYTIASFSDYKTTFSSWNLYKSLGLDPKEKGGIGELIYSILQEKLDDTNQEVEKLHQEYVRSVDEARVSEALLRQADSPDRMRMRKGELQVRAHHAEGRREERDKAHDKALGLSQLFPFLLDQYTQKFQEYFLEIFDAEAERTLADLYEDSPAGFRLCYKHGRSDPSAWTMISSRQEFFQSLRQFFLSAEPQIVSACEWEGGKEEIEALTTRIIHFLDTKEFQSSALKEKKPWSYTSGGNMHTLLKGYYCIEGELLEEKRSIKDPVDLLTFLLDLLKALPFHVTNRFETDPLSSLLMYSPTHAFLLKPGTKGFKEGWLDKGFTYTWIRDNVVNPGKQACLGVSLDKNLQRSLASTIIKKPFSLSKDFVSLPEFRKHLLKVSPNQMNEIDNMLYQTCRAQNPLIFADTNWADYFFAFAVNPGTLELDLYRISADGMRAYPMNIWRHYLDGTSSAPWGVLTRPNDLSGGSGLDMAFKLKKV